MYWLDIAAIGVIFVFAIMGFSGWLNRLRGLIFGILLGAIIIAATPFVLTKYDTGTHIDLKKSVVISYLNKYVPVSIKSKYEGKVVRSDG